MAKARINSTLNIRFKKRSYFRFHKSFRPMCQTDYRSDTFKS